MRSRRNPVTWGRDLRARAKNEKRPMVCVGFLEPEGGEVIYVGLGDKELVAQIVKIIRSVTKKES